MQPFLVWTIYGPRDFPEFEILNKYIKDSIQLDYEYSITPQSQCIYKR